MIAVWAIVPRFRADAATQDFLARPLGMLVAAAIAGSTLVTLVVWNWPQEHRALLWAVIVTSVLDMALLLLAERLRWLGGLAVRPGVGLQIMVYGPGFIAFVAIPLGLYRWIARRSAKAALLVYLGIVVAISVASVPVEEEWLRSGIYAFDGGYSIAWDVTWGVAQFLFALALYHGLQLRHTRLGAPNLD
jgi:hypothetical protein